MRPVPVGLVYPHSKEQPRHGLCAPYVRGSLPEVERPVSIEFTVCNIMLRSSHLVDCERPV